MPSSFTAGSSSKGKASSTQYFVITGATLASMNARTRFTVASSSAFKVSETSEKSLFGAGNGFGCFAGFAVAVAVAISVLQSFEWRQAQSIFERHPSDH